MKNIEYLIFMCISIILVIFVFKLIFSKKKKGSQLSIIMCLILASLFIWTLSLIFQILFQNSPISPVFFEGYAAFRCLFLTCFCTISWNNIW